MTRPVHFADQHTLARQNWIRSQQEQSNEQSLHAMQMLVACFGWGFGLIFAIVIGLAFADWMTGEFFASEVVANWRVRT